MKNTKNINTKCQQDVVASSLQTDRPSETSTLPDPEKKPVLAFERSLDAFENTGSSWYVGYSKLYYVPKNAQANKY